MNQKSIGRAVKEVRRIRGLTQTELAQRANLSSKTCVSLIENGHRGVSRDTLNVIAGVLGVPSAFLEVLGISATNPEFADLIKSTQHAILTLLKEPQACGANNTGRV